MELIDCILNKMTPILFNNNTGLVATAIIGFIITNKNIKRTKNLEIKTQILNNIFMFLADEMSNRESKTEEQKKNDYRILEKILTQIQFVGSKEAMRLSQEMCEKYKETNRLELDELMNSIRNDLRRSVGMCKIKKNTYWNRFNPKDVVNHV